MVNRNRNMWSKAMTANAKNHLCLIRKDIYESHMLNQVLCLEEECYFCCKKGIFPWGMKGQLIMVWGERGGFGKPAWRHFFLGCSHALLGKLGWGCLLIREDCTWDSTHSSCEPWLHVSLPGMLSGTSPPRRATATVLQQKHLLLRVHSTMDSPRMLQRAETPKELLWA